MEKVVFFDSLRYNIYMEHKYFQDIKFYQDLKTGYWITTKCPKKRMHVVVWESFYGKVPKGFHIHHIDEDKSNNDIFNLQLLKAGEHQSSHWNEEKKARARKHAEKIRPLTKEWHGSEEGRKWHREHGIDGWNNKKEIEGVCLQCGTKFTTKTYHQKFCSNNCKSESRRQSGIDNIEVICEFCYEIFTKNKYSKQKGCSELCRNKLSRKKGNRD